MPALYTEILQKPLFNLLVFLYTAIPGRDLGVTILVLTLIVRILLYPLNRRAITSQRSIQRLQPEMEALKEKHKDDREKLAQEMMALYKREKINPLSSCLPIVVQLPILIAVYQVFTAGIKSDAFQLLYPGIANPGTINTIAFGFLDLAARSWPLAILAGIAQYWQTRMLMGSKSAATSSVSAMNKQMLYIMPVMTVFIGSRFPAGLGLYWFATTVFTGLQQLLMFKKSEKKQGS